MDLTTARESPPIEYEVDEAHMRYCLTLIADRTYQPGRAAASLRKRVICGVAAAVGSVGSLLLLFYLEEHNRSKLWLVFSLIPTLVAATQLLDDRERRARVAAKYVYEHMESTLVRQYLGKYTLRVTDGGVAIDSPVEHIETRWPAVYGFTRTPGCVVVLLGRGSVYVPETAFDIVGGADAFVAFGKRCLVERGVGMERDMVAYLAANNVQCKGCGYNLRGNTSLVCPECRRAVSPEDVQAVWRIKR